MSPLITDARGTLGDLVYSIWRAGVHYVRTKAVDPLYPGTDLQHLMRDAKIAALAAWTALTQDQKALWEEYAQQFGSRNQDLDQGGGTRNLIPHHRPPITGQNAFIQCYLRMARAGLAPVLTPPTNPPPRQVEDLDINWNPGTNQLDVTWKDIGFGIFPPQRYLFETFEDEALNAEPNAWTPAWVYNKPSLAVIKVSSTYAYSGTKSARLSTGTIPCTAYYNIPQLATHDGIKIDHFCRLISPTSIQAVLQVYSAGGVSSCVQMRCASGYFQYYFLGAWVNLTPYVTGVWYQVRYVLHPATKTCDIYITNMVTPKISGLVYVNNVNAGCVYLTNGDVTNYVDDIDVYSEVIPSENVLFRLWLRSYQAHAHKQLITHAPVMDEVLHVSQARYALGVPGNLVDNIGLYYLQADVLSTDMSRHGLLSPPSKCFEVQIT